MYIYIYIYIYIPDVDGDPFIARVGAPVAKHLGGVCVCVCVCLDRGIYVSVGRVCSGGTGGRMGMRI